MAAWYLRSSYRRDSRPTRICRFGVIIIGLWTSKPDDTHMKARRNISWSNSMKPKRGNGSSLTVLNEIIGKEKIMSRNLWSWNIFVGTCRVSSYLPSQPRIHTRPAVLDRKQHFWAGPNCSICCFESRWTSGSAAQNPRWNQALKWWPPLMLGKLTNHTH